jgi:RNA polymerase sigma-70 factor, ECF subfamily
MLGSGSRAVLPPSSLLSLLPADRRPDDDATRDAWAQWLARAAAERPDVASDPARVVALLATRLEGPLTAAALAELDGPELWLAAGCGQGLAPALERFDREYLGGLERALGHMKLDADRVAEVRQRVREKLLMPEAGTTKLEQYAGRGQLASLVGVVAVRAALDLMRAAGRTHDVPDAGDAAAALVDEHGSPELAAIKAQHADAFKAAFEAAVEALDPGDRGLLRLHLMDHLGIDAIAALHGVHRSTAARWLQGIRDALGSDVRRRLRERLGRGRGDIDSLLRAVDSQLDLSFSRILAR